ncbi:MAG: hypothetical protein OHK93_003712 [Ramalina farinacea]|uniref:MOZ protein represents a chromatin-associated acetyltransferase n=1 Tax=Ramalina farinacea TaxID=258253 RepID=A0AA43TYC3_9LECA|nr:hypothetical protein [Ramalina farinacea]
MSLPRLTFLYPHLFKAPRQQEIRYAVSSLRSPLRQNQAAGLKTTKKRRQETYAQRYGTAQEPQPPPPPGSQIPPKQLDDKSLAGAMEKEVKSPPAKEERKDEKKADAGPQQQQKQKPPQKAAEPEPEERQPEETKNRPPIGPLYDRAKAIETALQDPAQRAKQLDASTPPTEKSPKSNDTVTPSTEAQRVQAKPLNTRGGFSAEQSVSVMKAVRGLLAQNLDVAREGLVGKSDVENEVYLFRAACSELRTEILNLRRSSTSKQKTQLSHLQHTYDILSQRTTAELASLRDELKGMLNDRRMDTRENSQVLDSAISELNYKISVNLNSETKSEVEGLRWVLTRRAAMAIAFAGILILGSLRVGSYKMHERENEARKSAGRGQGEEGSGGGGGGGGGHGDKSGDAGADAAKSGGKVGDLGYVSLG